jgi:uncharacterized membrane protein
MANNDRYRKRKRAIRSLYKRIRWQKTLSWRIISILTATLSAWVITGSAVVGLTIGGVDMIVKSLLYYFHEKKWERIIKDNIKKIKKTIQ